MAGNECECARIHPARLVRAARLIEGRLFLSARRRSFWELNRCFSWPGSSLGDPSSIPRGLGPQGDVIRIYNYAQAVRDNGWRPSFSRAWNEW